MAGGGIFAQSLAAHFAYFSRTECQTFGDGGPVGRKRNITASGASVRER